MPGLGLKLFSGLRAALALWPASGAKAWVRYTDRFRAKAWVRARAWVRATASVR